MACATIQLLASLLKDTSRSFYLTLRVLPSKIRPQIGLAYLLARTADTIADTDLVPLEKRLQALQTLRDRILDSRQASLDFSEFARHQGAPAERALLERCKVSVDLVQALDPADRTLMLEVLNTIISGQELDLRRFAGASADRILALRTDAELEDYTYRVAGCVGEFWTKMCRAHVFPQAPLDDSFLLANGVRFGKGLQLVNILRDLPVDLRHGRCYLPAERLSAFCLEPQALLEPANEPRLRPLYDSYLDQAQAHLLAGWAYTNALPRRNIRVRLACAWPILIGLQTLARLRAAKVLDAQQRVKVSRPEIRRVILHSVLYYPWPVAWRRLVRASTAAKTIASRGVLA